MGLIYTYALAVRGWLGQTYSPELREDLARIRTIWDAEVDVFREKDQASPRWVLEELHRRSENQNALGKVAGSIEDYRIALSHKDECLFD